ncbi:MAG TPA: tripartite tricarboxylate transporter substrate binding protein [Beijerinckiaceae bacterium]|jgi:tripartite-type tricarboxylate transporter receptor subunit TctC
MSFACSRRAAIMGLALAACAAAPALAQSYPTKPVTMIVPFTAGGGGDILARIMGQKLEEKWGKPLIVENRPGAGGIVGAVAAAKAPADGYTLLIAPSATIAVNVTLYKSLPYDPAKDFTPLAVAARTPFVLVANPKLPVKNVKELIAYAKDRPEPLFYATAGPGVPHHLFTELLKSMADVKMQPVAYKGSLPALNDVVAGHVPVMFIDLGPALSQIKAGNVRPLGVSTAERLAELPDVPPVADTLPGFDVSSWQMVLAPAGVPQPILDKLSADFAEVLKTSEVTQTIGRNGMLPVAPTKIPELQKYVTDEIARWGDVVRKAGIAGTQ